MPTFSPQAVNVLTIAAGMVSLLVAAGMIYFNRPCHSAKQGLTAIVNFGFTATPILLLVWNSLASALAEMRGIPATAAGPTLNVGAPLLAYAGISVLIQIGAELTESVRLNIFRNPGGA